MKPTNRKLINECHEINPKGINFNYSKSFNRIVELSSGQTMLVVKKK